MKKLPKVNTSKLLKAALPYILVGLMATKLGQAYRMASGGDVLDRIFGAFLKIGEAFANPLPSLHPFDLLVGDACGALLWFIVYQKSKNARKYRRGAEYGTARWGNAKDMPKSFGKQSRLRNRVQLLFRKQRICLAASVRPWRLRCRSIKAGW